MSIEIDLLDPASLFAGVSGLGAKKKRKKKKKTPQDQILEMLLPKGMGDVLSDILDSGLPNPFYLLTQLSPFGTTTVVSDDDVGAASPRHEDVEIF